MAKCFSQKISLFNILNFFREILEKKCKGVVSMRKHYSSEFKAKVALESVKGAMTLSELSQKFEVHPNMISN